jgi:phage tail-like protein
MDANGTRFHLILGRDDWSRCRDSEMTRVSESREVQWNNASEELTLFASVDRFKGSRSDPRLTSADRRGAARDQFGNWYWISEDRLSVLVLSSGSKVTSIFWPVQEPLGGGAAGDGSFQPQEVDDSTKPTLHGLTISEDNYLVIGASGPDGLIVFDLYSGGSPRRQLWPHSFTPISMAPRKDGGVWILDASGPRVWELDRRFDVVISGTPFVPTGEYGGFENDDLPPGEPGLKRAPLLPVYGWPVAASLPVSILAMPDDGVLVLEPLDKGRFARVHYLAGGRTVGTVEIAPLLPRDAALISKKEATLDLVAHDFALGKPDPGDVASWLGRLYVAAADGNQSYAFGVAIDQGQLRVHPLAEYFPMRLFRGRALVVADGDPWYDSSDRWVKLLKQYRPRFAEQGELITPVLDSGEPGCVWHRLMLDACIPPSSTVDVYSRAADDWNELAAQPWFNNVPDDDSLTESDFTARIPRAVLKDWQPEPRPYLRSDGSEIPFLPGKKGEGRGTWELLFQRATGRYLQIKLVLSGDLRSTPRIRALRAWYPRFSYLEHYLPAVYRDDSESASFLDRFLANTEGILTATEDRIAAAQVLFDVSSAPPETLDWLAEWFGIALDPSWEESRRRLLIKHAVDFFALRGTLRGLRLALRLALDECVDDKMFESDTTRSTVRIIERFRARKTSPALLGDVRLAVPGPARVETAARWDPSFGAADLNRRYRAELSLSGSVEFSLAAEGAPAGWKDFAESQLGFVPRAAASERKRWRKFLQQRHGSVGALNSSHQSSWNSFGDVNLPVDEPLVAGAAEDWRKFLAKSKNPDRTLWHAFLTRRYRNVGALNSAWGTTWSRLGLVTFPDRIPSRPAKLSDWFQFEGTVLRMRQLAHRFTVMLPVARHQRTSVPAQQRRMAVARALLDLEKPAHTVFDMRFYWSMFRLGEARLGSDTLIDLGSRSPQLMGPMVLGEGYLAEAFLAASPGHDAPARIRLGRDRLGRSSQLGGP